MMAAPISGGSASLAAHTSDEMELLPKQILTFQEVAPAQEQTLPGQVELVEELKTTAVEGRGHNIIDFLERVYKIADGTIPEGGAPGDVLNTYIFPDIMLGLKQIKNKISGFMNFRASVEVTFVITAQPAQLGGLRLSYFPDINADQLALRSQHVLQLSQCPHITINITKNQNSAITLPWISPYTHRNMVTGVGRNGTLVLSRLTPSAGGVVNYQMYARFMDVSIEYPTGMLLSDEMLALKEEKRIQSEAQSMREELELLRLKVNRKSPIITEGLSEASKFLQSGVLSQTASAVSGVANMLSGIPVIGSIASAVSPIAGALSNVFSSFGWSKPVNDKPPHQLKIQPGASSITADGVYNGHEITFCTGNTVKTDNGSFGSQLDEMDIDYIMRSPNTIDIFPITTEMTPGTVLARYPIDLCKWFQLETTGVYYDRRFFLTHQTMVAHLFRWWMATCVFDFEGYMTKFHNVRLRFTVIPGATDSTDLSTVTIDDNNSTVIVFGDTVTYQAVCPEVSATPFLKVRGVEGNQTPFNDQTVTTIGQLVVFLEVPLKATSDIAPTTVYVETKFHAQNVRFGVPSQVRAYAVNNLAPLEVEDDVIRTQGLSSAALYSEGHLPGRSDVMESGITPGMNSDGAKPNGGILHATFGEMVKSLKQIMLGFQYWGYYNNTTGSVNPVLVDVGTSSLTNAGLFVNKPTNYDIIDTLMSMYAFYKGGFHLRILREQESTRNFWVYLSQQAYLAPSRILLSPTDQVINGIPFTREIPIIPFLEGVIDVRVPYWQGTHMVRVPYDSAQSFDYLERTPIVIGIGQMGYDTDKESFNISFQRSVADDFCMGFLYAIPPIQLRYNVL
jgi:hypothetical protein